MAPGSDNRPLRVTSLCSPGFAFGLDSTKILAVLLAAEDLEAIEATLELLSHPAAQERITQSRDEIARGEGLSIAEVARSLEERFGNRRP
jgi:hypothetical protein